MIESSLAGSITQRRLQRMANRLQPTDSTDDATLSTLKILDGRLTETLGNGDIRLLRSSWLLSQSPGFVLPPCQDLRAIGENYSADSSPLLSAEEAIALIHRGNRSLGVCTYGWLTSSHCDPCGARLHELREGLMVLPHIEAVFWDFASLPQHPRTADDDEVFARALSVMGDLYSSAVGTTVLQLRELPPRPAEFDGVVTLHGLNPRATERSIRELCSEHTIVEVSLPRCSVKFESRRVAIAAVKSGALSTICTSADFYYNERPYHKRGWCCFEDAVSSELVVRLTAFPQMLEVLSTLPPKMFVIASGQEVTPVVHLSTDSRLASRVDDVSRHIHSAVFTGTGDKEQVVALYKDYVTRIADALGSALGSVGGSGGGGGGSAEALLAPHDTRRFGRGGGSWEEGESEPPPRLSLPPTDPLAYAPGQLLVLAQNVASRREGGDGTSCLCLAVGDGLGVPGVPAVRGEQQGGGNGHGNGGDSAGSNEQPLSLLMTLTPEVCSHSIIPWRPHADGDGMRGPVTAAAKDATVGSGGPTATWEEDLANSADLISALAERVRRLHSLEASAVAASTSMATFRMISEGDAAEWKALLDAASRPTLAKAIDAFRALPPPAIIQPQLELQQQDEGPNDAAGAGSASTADVEAGTEVMEAAAPQQASSPPRPVRPQPPAIVPASASTSTSFPHGGVAAGLPRVEPLLQAIAIRGALTAHAKRLRQLEPLGLRWTDAGAKRPAAGSEILSEALATALGERRTSFTQAEAEALLGGSATLLRADSYVRAVVESTSGGGAGGGGETRYFRPSVGEKLRPVQQLSKRLDALGKSSNPNFLATEIGQIGKKALAVWVDAGVPPTRRYAAGQWLSVRRGQHEWADVQAPREGASSAESGADSATNRGVVPLPLQLHPWNHAPRQLPSSAFSIALEWWRSTMRSRHSRVADVLTGRQLDVMEQCVSIDIAIAEERHDAADGGSGDNGDRIASIEDSASLAVWLGHLHIECCSGIKPIDTPPAVLLTAGPATGKTSMLSQVVMHALASTELIPILIKVQQLQVSYLNAPEAFGQALNWVDAYICLTYGGESSPVYRMLRQAMLSRRALILLDGLEGGRARTQIERHVTHVLAKQGHVMVVTARPSGVDEALFGGFRRLTLAPLTEEQQHAVIRNRLRNSSQVTKLVAYLDRVPRDSESGLRVTSNPLMLSMVISIFELRSGVEMPSKIAKMYSIAAQAMLERTGDIATAPSLHDLLRATFFEAHVNQQRVIEPRQLVEAALALRAPERLATLRQHARRNTPIRRYDGAIEIGHFIEIVDGEFRGCRGVLIIVDTDANSYKAQILTAAASAPAFGSCGSGSGSNSGQDSGTYGRLIAGGIVYGGSAGYSGLVALLKANDFKSSGMTESGFLANAMASYWPEVQSAAAEALPAEMRHTLDVVRDRVRKDTLPLLALLTADPLQCQSSHLSFQEYFAACAICEGAPLSGVSPWQFPSWWSNALTLGAEMGEPFRYGLKKSANVDNELNLNARIDGHRPTALHAVALLMTTLKEVNLWGNKIDGAESQVLAEALTLSGSTLRILNLGTNDLGDEGAQHFAAALPSCASLRSIDLSRNQIGKRGGMALADAIKRSRANGGNALDQVFLWRNSFDDKVKAALAKTIAKV